MRPNEITMRNGCNLERQALRRPPVRCLLLLALPIGLILVAAPPADSACCYFSAKDKDILQPAQKAFLTWDPVEKVETFTVQPKFEGNALDFGMVIPTPTQPKLHEMPRDFFKHLAIYSIMKRREFAQSKLLPVFEGRFGGRSGAVREMAKADRADERAEKQQKDPTVIVLETGVV